MRSRTHRSTHRHHRTSLTLRASRSTAVPSCAARYARRPYSRINSSNRSHSSVPLMSARSPVDGATADNQVAEQLLVAPDLDSDVGVLHIRCGQRQLDPVSRHSSDGTSRAFASDEPACTLAARHGPFPSPDRASLDPHRRMGLANGTTEGEQRHPMTGAPEASIADASSLRLLERYGALDMLATVGSEHGGEPLVVSVLTCGIPAPMGYPFGRSRGDLS